MAISFLTWYCFLHPESPTSSAVQSSRYSCTMGWTLRGACSLASWKLRKLQAQTLGPNQQQMVLSVQRAQAQMSGMQMASRTLRHDANACRSFVDGSYSTSAVL